MDAALITHILVITPLAHTCVSGLVFPDGVGKCGRKSHYTCISLAPRPPVRNSRQVVEDKRDVPTDGRVAGVQGPVCELRGKWLLKGDLRPWGMCVPPSWRCGILHGAGGPLIRPHAERVYVTIFKLQASLPAHCQSRAAEHSGSCPLI